MWRRWCRLPCCWPRQGPGLQGRTGRASRVASQPAAPASRVLSRSATTRADGLPGGSPVRPRAPGATPPYPAFCRPAGRAAARTSGQQQPGLGERHGSICRGGQLLPATGWGLGAGGKPNALGASLASCLPRRQCPSGNDFVRGVMNKRSGPGRRSSPALLLQLSGSAGFIAEAVTLVLLLPLPAGVRRRAGAATHRPSSMTRRSCACLVRCRVAGISDEPLTH